MKDLESLKKIPFSVLMPVYGGDKSDLVKKALLSILSNSIKPNQIVIVIDGPISAEIQKEINFLKDDTFDIIKLPKNKGIVNALNKGLEVCKHQLIARCDADDENLPMRFELQLYQFYTDKNLDLCGGHIIEVDGINKYKRMVPISDTEVRKSIKLRNPFNHMTVMFKKNAVLSAGKYQQIMYREDYALWAKMYSIGHKIKNIDETLVIASGGIAMYERRGKFSDIGFEIQLQKYLFSLNIINVYEYARNIIIRVGNMMISPKIRGFFYANFLRKKSQ